MLKSRHKKSKHNRKKKHGIQTREKQRGLHIRGRKMEKRREGVKGRRDRSRWGRETVFSIIIVDWLGLRATSYLLVFPFYITTNLLLISYY